MVIKTTAGILLVGTSAGCYGLDECHARVLYDD